MLISVNAVDTYGFLEIMILNPEYVRNVKAPIGIVLDKIGEKARDRF
jgi:hypothetical protein